MPTAKGSQTGLDQQRILSVGDESAPRRELIAEQIYERLHGPVAALGLVFVAVVVSEAVAPPGTPRTILAIASWTLWALFVAEYVVRLMIAPDTRSFVRRTWWQIVFLLLPFLNFLRAVLLLRAVRFGRFARAGRLASAALRGGRSAAKTLQGRIGWLAALTLVVVLLGADVLYEFGGIDSYSQALHRAALGAIAGEPTLGETGVAKAMDVVFAIYSIVVFAALAGVLGEYFLKVRAEPHGDV